MKDIKIRTYYKSIHSSENPFFEEDATILKNESLILYNRICDDCLVVTEIQKQIKVAKVPKKYIFNSLSEESFKLNLFLSNAATTFFLKRVDPYLTYTFLTESDNIGIEAFISLEEGKYQWEYSVGSFKKSKENVPLLDGKSK
jgi:hypothetical protein